MTETKPQNEIHRVVVKFGTAILTRDDGRLNEPLIRRWVDRLADLKDNGMEILIVSSGAIGAGIGEMAVKKRPTSLPQKQALAAIGQGLLMDVWGQGFRPRGHHVAQILLTRGDMDDRRRHLNVRNCLQQLLGMNVIPIINENDTVAVDELTFSDNDTLAAIIASKVQADLLVILTDVDGLYEEDPRENPDAPAVPLVEHDIADVQAMASRTTSALGSGGMRSKILAAQAAMRAGIPVVIANGSDPRNLSQIIEGKPIGTRFSPPPGAQLSARDRWIAIGASTSNRILTVDAGARRALIEGKKSLLPAGIAKIKGAFEAGDAIEIHDEKGTCFAKGLSNYSSEDMKRIQGRQSSEIEEILGEKQYDEAIHRDNMVVLEET